jgi:hypothetical protein
MYPKSDLVWFFLTTKWEMGLTLLLFKCFLSIHMKSHFSCSTSQYQKKKISIQAQQMLCSYTFLINVFLDIFLVHGDIFFEVKPQILEIGRWRHYCVLLLLEGIVSVTTWVSYMAACRVVAETTWAWTARLDQPGPKMVWLV